jgi:adenylylsulfate kinase-like enzyme
VRSGAIAEFAGVAAPYEHPGRPDVTLDAEHETLDACVAKIIGKLDHYLERRCGTE